MKLTQRRIGTLPAGRHGDSDCKTLFVVVQPSGSRAFVQRLTVNGKRVDRGLGGWPLRTLAEARAIASANRRAARLDGRDPFTAPHNVKPLFRDAAEATLAANRGRWSESSARAFMQPLRGCNVLRVLGQHRVNAISRQDIIGVLKPVWTSKPAESRKALQRVRAVLDWCLAHGHVSENVAANGGIKAALPVQERVRRHHEAVPYRDVPSAYRSILGSQAADSARACAAFLVLTATRSAEARGARWDEIDLGGKTWTIPAARMKSKRAQEQAGARRAAERPGFVDPRRATRAAHGRASVRLRADRPRPVADGADPDGAEHRRHDPRLPLLVPRLGVGGDGPRLRRRRNGVGPCGGLRGRAGVPPRRPPREASPVDGRLGRTRGWLWSPVR